MRSNGNVRVEDSAFFELGCLSARQSVAKDRTRELPPKQTRRLRAMHSRCGKPICHRVYRQLKEELPRLLRQNRNATSNLSSTVGGIGTDLSGSEHAIFESNFRSFNTLRGKRGCNSGVPDVCMARGTGELGLGFWIRTGVANTRARSDTSVGKGMGKEQELGEVAGEALAAVDTVEDDGNISSGTPSSKDGAGGGSQSGAGHPDPNGEENIAVDEEVRRGLVADSAVQYGHDRERQS